MKPTYNGFEAKANKGAYLDVPPVGAYVAEIQDVRFVPADGNKQQRDAIELMIEITEGEYKNRYHDLYKDQDEKWGNAKYRGTFSLYPPAENDEDWRKRVFEGNLWCVEQSNNGYKWDWDEKKLKGKAVGINIRKKLYTYTKRKDNTEETVEAETTEIAKFETVDDVKNGKCRMLKERDTRHYATSEQNFTPVDSASVSVPW